MSNARELTVGSDGGLERSMVSSAPDLQGRLVDAAAAAIGRDRAKAQRTLQRALASLMASHGSPDARCAGPPRGGLAPWQAKRVAAYVREHIGTSLRVSDLASLVQLSNSHFNRAFKVSFKETPAVYIVRQRMRLAQDMMLTTQHPLSQVALECGLCDQAHFSRMFRRIVGQSPRLWRRQFASDSKARPRCEQAAH